MVKPLIMRYKDDFLFYMGETYNHPYHILERAGGGGWRPLSSNDFKQFIDVKPKTIDDML